jgi:3',5'-cyclic AMP phosphodiesterase CpdA
MSDSMFRLAHISDIHLGPLPRLTTRELATKRITGYVNWHRNRRKRLFGKVLELLREELQAAAPDHIAITGDLINLGSRTEIETVIGWLQETGSPDFVSVVPGNHDAYVPGAFKMLCSQWQSYMQGDEHLVSVAGDHHFPYVRRRGKVALIGLSTAHATPPFVASGLFDRHQALRLRNVLEETAADGLFRVIMIHHPPVRGATRPYKRMFGIGRFGEVLADHGAELVLHGHTHLDTLYHLPGKTGTVPVVGVPSASEGHGGSRPPAGYNLLTIDGTPGSWTCRLERHGLDETGSRFEQKSEEAL